jgi:hypothetical protein
LLPVEASKQPVLDMSGLDAVDSCYWWLLCPCYAY